MVTGSPSADPWRGGPPSAPGGPSRATVAPQLGHSMVPADGDRACWPSSWGSADYKRTVVRVFTERGLRTVREGNR